MPSYRLTPARMRALKKAQLVSARKRKGKGKRNAIIGATGVSLAVLAGGAAYGRHKLSGSSLTMHDSPRTHTPMINIAGVAVPGTRAGLRVSNYGRREGFSATYTSRNSKGDKLLFGYRHIPLTKEALKSAFGRKIAKGVVNKTPWLKDNRPDPDYRPSGFDQKLFDDISNGGSMTKENRARVRVGQRTSYGGGLVRSRTIPEIEVIARTGKYKASMKSAGIDIDWAHESYIASRFRELNY